MGLGSYVNPGYLFSRPLPPVGFEAIARNTSLPMTGPAI
jgi:hypothetical protein